MIKIRLLSAALALVFLLTIMPLQALAAEIQAAPFVTALTDDTEIQSVETEGETYIFLPASADITRLTLHFADEGNIRLRGNNGSRSAGEIINLNIAPSVMLRSAVPKRSAIRWIRIPPV